MKRLMTTACVESGKWADIRYTLNRIHFFFLALPAFLDPISCDFLGDLSQDPHPMKRAVAFCQVIERHQGQRTHKVSSKQIGGMFQKVVSGIAIPA